MTYPETIILMLESVIWNTNCIPQKKKIRKFGDQLWNFVDRSEAWNFNSQRYIIVSDYLLYSFVDYAY